MASAPGGGPGSLASMMQGAGPQEQAAMMQMLVSMMTRGGQGGGPAI